MYIRVHLMRDSVCSCTGTNEWSIDHIYTTHSLHMEEREREGGTDRKCEKGGEGGRENTTLTCTCMVYRHRSHTYRCVGD